MGLHKCGEDGCDRSFLSEAQLYDHSEAVHSFDDIRRTVRAALKAKYTPEGQVVSNTPQPYVWIRDISSDWVVFDVESPGGGDSGPWKQSYALDASMTVTFSGEPVRVIETTVYVPVATGTSNASMVDAFMVAAMEAAAAAKNKAGSSPKPYGNVTYADPKNGKYPIDTEEHVRAAWSYVNQAQNAAKYPMNGVSLDSVKAKIRAAAKKFGIQISG